MNKLIIIPIIAVIFVLIDLYVYQGVAYLIRNLSGQWRNIIKYVYWGITVITIAVFFLYHFGNPEKYSATARSFILVWIFINYVSKFVGVIFLLIDDVVRLGKWIVGMFQDRASGTASNAGESISRSDFLVKTALIGASVPLLSMGYGIITGAHDYRVRRQRIALPNLPKAFDGLTIGQVSDIHSGSFFNKTAVKGGVEMLLKEKPDIIFFTGDLVNNEATEVEDYITIFGKIAAPLGVFSILGNHDYGDYMQWGSQRAKVKNLEDVVAAHKIMGWDILMDENRMVEQGGEQIAIIGNQNWGAGRFAKYGNLEKAYQGTVEAPVKLLLSHDPSHWDAQVLPNYPDIDVMFAGHTHGFQFGVEIGGFKWSPAQYAYKQWAGLYSQNNQHLYVNRGFGYLGYPGRIGMPPEITMIELVRG